MKAINIILILTSGGISDWISYTGNVIPYWKTETVEAMSAFHFKESFMTGAGECVSLSALYAAALFIVGEYSA